VVDPIDVMQTVSLSNLFVLVNILTARVTALEAVLAIKSDGSVVLSGRDIEIKASGKATIKAGGNIVLKGMKIVQN